MSGKEARQRRAERIASAASRINEEENIETEVQEEEPIEYELFERYVGEISKYCNGLKYLICF